MTHPRPYISYSQLICWEQSPAEYMERYLRGKKGRTNKGQAVGKKMADSLETGEETGEIEMDIVVAQMPKYAFRDKEIMVRMSVGKGKERSFIPILIKPDSTREDYKAFYEYKQGDEGDPWTQKRVDEDDQITFYTTGLYLKIREAGGIEIPTSELIWAPTVKYLKDSVNEEYVPLSMPVLTGQIIRIPTKRTFTQILQMQARISKAWREIGEAIEREML